MVRSYKTLYRVIITISVVLFCNIGNNIYAITTEEISDNLSISLSILLNTINTLPPNDQKNPTLILNNICNYFQSKQWIQIIEPIKWDQSYRHDESILVSIVCNSINTEFKNKSEVTELPIINSIIKKESRTFWWIGLICPPTNTNSDIDLIPHNCVSIPSDYNININSAQIQIDYQRLLYNTITAILNDIINISTARIYGATDPTKEKKTRDLANAYLAKHYNTIWHISESKPYTQTTSHMQSYIQAWNRIYDNVKIIDLTKTALSAAQSNNLKGKRITFLNHDTEQTQGATYTGIVDIIYNEFFFYQLMSTMLLAHQHLIREDKNNIPLSLHQPGINNVNFYINQYRWKIQDQHQTLLNTINESFKELNHLQSRFPVHIGLMLYQEDLLKMRNSLAKIYLPLHQLHYKLENVQSKE